MPKEQIIVQLNPDVPPTGTCLGIVNAARKSFGRRSEWEMHYETDDYHEYGKKRLKDKDKRLLEFLARGMTADDFEDLCERSFLWNWLDGDAPRKEILIEKLWGWRNTPTHDTPFNHGFFSFEIKAPIFVARHLVKHEYLIMSEYSRRYITEDVEFYEPDWRGKAEDVKQGSSDEEVFTEAMLVRTEFDAFEGYTYTDFNTLALGVYQELLGDGVAPEQARMVLPQSLMTAWTWSGTLGAFANMCKLRLSPDTQYETRLVAQQVYEELKKQFPVAAPLLVEGVY